MTEQQIQNKFQKRGGSEAGVISISASRRFWQRFCANRLGFVSFVLFALLTLLSFGAELFSNDRPLVVRYEGQWYFPVMQDLPETIFGGDFESPTDYHDPLIQTELHKEGNFALFTLNRYGADTLNYFESEPNPAPPSATNYMGTDRQGRDVLAQLIYGYRVSVAFALVLTCIGVLVGMLTGAVQGYFAGKVDLLGQRVIEVWTAMPPLYLLIIFSSIFRPSILLLVILLSLFSWVGISNYIRAEFLRNRQLDFVRSAKAMGLSHWQIIYRHILPNSMMPVITFAPFMMTAAIVTLTSLDFLGLGVPPETPSLGALLRQGKQSLDAWWISLSTFALLFFVLMMLTFMGDALRNALDPRHQPKIRKAKR